MNRGKTSHRLYSKGGGRKNYLSIICQFTNYWVTVPNARSHSVSKKRIYVDLLPVNGLQPKYKHPLLLSQKNGSKF